MPTPAPDLFKNYPESLAVYDQVAKAVGNLRGVEIRTQKSQVGFYRDHPFAAVWRPGQHLSGERPPLVLSLFLRRRLRSKRWKEISEPRPGRFTHHLELNAPAEVDRQVRGWLKAAWDEAG